MFDDSCSDSEFKSSERIGERISRVYNPEDE